MVDGTDRLAMKPSKTTIERLSQAIIVCINVIIVSPPVVELSQRRPSPVETPSLRASRSSTDQHSALSQTYQRQKHRQSLR